MVVGLCGVGKFTLGWGEQSEVGSDEAKKEWKGVIGQSVACGRHVSGYG